VRGVAEGRGKGRTGRTGSAALSRRVARLLWVCRSPIDVEGSGLLDTAAAPLLCMEAMGPAQVSGTPEPRCESGTGLEYVAVGAWPGALKPQSGAGHRVIRALL